MNIKKINELEFVEKAEGLYSVCSDANGNTKRYKISTSQGGGDCPFEKGDGKNSAVLKESENKVIGKFSIALGYGNNISSDSSAAFGYNNIVENNCCTAEGANNKVCGDNSHVEGRECIVEGHESHAEGNYTKVYGHCSHGEGTSCRVLGDNSHVEGHSSVVYGHVGHAEGQYCAAGDLDQIEKPSSERTDAACHAEGIRTTAKAMASHSEGIDTHSMGVASHAEGRGTYATADASHAEGLNSKSGLRGYYFKGIDIKNKKIYLSVTKPETIKTSGFASSDFENIEFPYDIESDLLSIINGEIYYDSLKVTKTNKSVIYVESLPFKSIAEINNLYLDSNYTIFCIDKYKLGGVNVSLGSHAEGYSTRSFGIASHTDGYNTISKNLGEHASGIYNISNPDTQFSIGIGESEENRRNAFEVKQNGDIYIEGVEGRIQDKLNSNGQESIISVNYQELVNLRNNSQLIPCMQYRITDYMTTVGEPRLGVEVDGKIYATASTHQFDIIVTADSTNVLNETARAIQHEGDTYFSNSNLAAWKIWYCLDNDKYRFNWANSNNGKGVIYRMIDEFNNDCPYDFKNIKLLCENDDFRYTFGNKSIDASVRQIGINCGIEGHIDYNNITQMNIPINNVIKPRIISTPSEREIIFRQELAIINFDCGIIWDIDASKEKGYIDADGCCQDNIIGGGCTNIFIRGYNNNIDNCSNINLIDGSIFANFYNNIFRNCHDLNLTSSLDSKIYFNNSLIQL